MAPAALQATTGGSPAAGPSKGESSTRSKKDKREKVAQRMKTNAMRRKVQNEELRVLQEAVDSYKPAGKVETFDELPLSARTKKGLKTSHFVNPTPIQALSLPASLKGQDILGSARTGSGKTIAFLIPMLEKLYREKWGPMDGLGAIVLSPTRELAIQTFNALRSIGQYHQFSAGLVIGGKNVKDEQVRLARMNILIATPGRLLQHFDSTVGLDTSGVKSLILDEADRLLDLGFMPTLKAILGHLSQDDDSRQTMLFSATQSPDLVQLAKLSLNDPFYINVNRPGEEGVMPANLEQFYAVVPLDRKLDALWGFVKSHLKMKGVVFVSSCKQVRFVFETFRRLHPGLPLMHLHGKQKQPTRLEIFQRFSSSPNALLICTDIASRGLDFPAVDWVVQLDCPEDVDMYIHRVGRTARYQSEGKGLCILLPSEEEGMLARWASKGIEVKKIKIKESKMGQLQQQMQGFAFREPEIKYIGQRAFISYLKSVYIQKDKSIFKLDELPVEAFAASLGLPGAPQIKFVRDAASKAKNQKNQNRAAQALGKADKETPTDLVKGAAETAQPADEERSASPSDKSESDEESESDVPSDDGAASAPHRQSALDKSVEPSERHSQAVRTKYDRMFERKNQSVLTPHYTSLIEHNDVPAADDDDDFLKLEKRDHALEDVGLSDLGIDLSKESGNTAAATPSADLSKRKAKMAESKKAMLKLKGIGHKVTFDDEGQAHEVYEMEDLDDFAKKGDARAQQETYLEAERKRMAAADVIDRQVAREKRQEKKRKRKERERELMAAEMEEGAGAVLGNPSDDEDSSGEEDFEEPAVKRQRADAKYSPVDAKATVDEEELALRLLRGE